MKEFVIDRAKWRCGGTNGHGKGEVNLLNKEGYMCCLGMTCKQSGISNKELLGTQDPSDISNKYIKYFTMLSNGISFNTKLSNKAIEINDDDLLTDEEREQKLKSLFSKWKIKLVFKGKYND